MSLTTIQMARMSKLLDEALPLDEPGRRGWLEALPAADRDLALPLREALLGGADEGESAFTLFGAGEESSEMSGLQPGASVGPYQLIRLLGSGGMAEVWLPPRAGGALQRPGGLTLPRARRLQAPRGTQAPGARAHAQGPRTALLARARHPREPRASPHRAALRCG